MKIKISILIFIVIVNAVHANTDSLVKFDSIQVAKNIEMAKEFQVKIISDFKKLKFYYEKTKAVVAEIAKHNKIKYEFGEVVREKSYDIIIYSEPYFLPIENEDGTVEMVDDAQIQIFIDNKTGLIFKILFGG